MHLQTTYTDEHGRYRFEINNDLAEDEGGYDFSIKILSCGEYVSVCNDEREVYIKTIYLVDNISSGEHNNNSATFSMTESDVNTELFGQALQIAEAAIFASKYYYDMNGTTNGNVMLVYPHNERSGDCYYAGNGEIRIVGDLENTTSSLKSYSSWDVIMHEYGHYVEDKENITNNFGGSHRIHSSMAEHYYSHLTDNLTFNCQGECAFARGDINEDQCKLAGISIAWSEGWATYFSIASQEYGIKELFLSESIETVGDKTYRSYNDAFADVEGETGITEDAEATVQSILYDMYDFGDDSGADLLALGHRALWLLVKESKAKTFDEFDNYFIANHDNKEDLEGYRKLLSLHNLALGDRTENGFVIPGVVTGELTMNCPRFECLGAYNNSLYLDDRTFVLNFYDEDKTLIGRTAEQAGRVFTIDSALWQSVLDSGERFYVSATIIENHEPKTEYEGQWYEFEISKEIPTANEQTQYTVALSDEQYYWYSFTAPCSTTYTFKTSGNVDTTGAVFSKITAGGLLSGALAYNDNYQDDNDFTIKIYIAAGETVYIRIGVNGEITEESFDFWIFGEHDFTSSYVSNGLYGHTAYCECGAYMYDSHVWVITDNSSRCRLCLYVTQRTVVPVFKSLAEEEEQILYYDDKQRRK